MVTLAALTAIFPLSSGAQCLLNGDLRLSRTLSQADCPGVTVVSDNLERTVATLKEKPGKDIWLFGGGSLFRSLLDLELVDSVEVAIIPVLLGGGVPLLPDPASRDQLKLSKHKVYPKSGTVALEYAVT